MYDHDKYSVWQDCDRKAIKMDNDNILWGIIDKLFYVEILGYSGRKAEI